MFLLLSGCKIVEQINNKIKETNSPKILKSKDTSFQITAPNGWKQSEDIVETTRIETRFTFEAVSIRVNKIEKSDYEDGLSLDAFTDVNYKEIPKQVQKVNITEITHSTVGGFEAREFTATGLVGKTKSTYHYAVIESNKNFYVIISWAVPSVAEKYKSQMLDAIHSFKELNSADQRIKTNSNSSN